MENIHSKIVNTKPFTYIALGLIVILGFYLRFENISPYKYYPDSYQNLVVANNITTYGSVAGALGDEGAPYPQYFMWSRPVYPVFINLTNYFIKDLTKSAQIVSYIFGVLTIILVYILAGQIFKSNSAGLLSATLAATSFNYTVWSGFIMSDTTGIFFLVLFLNFLFYTLPRKSNFTDLIDILTGAAFSLAVFSRYEYLIFALPVLFLLISKNAGLEKIINIAVGFLIASSVIFVALFPIADTMRLIVSQTKQFIFLGILALVLLLIFFRYAHKNYDNYAFLFEKLFLVLGALPFILLGKRGDNLELPILVGLGNFMTSDVILTIFGFLGISTMFKSKDEKELSLFLTISFLLMEIVYFKINPLQQRYHIHIVIFLIISAVYFLYYALTSSRYFKSFKKLSIVCLISVLLSQTYETYDGIKDWNNGDWFKESYEEISAKSLKANLSGGEILFSAMPEAYYYFTNNSTRGLTDDAPFIYVNDLDKNQEVVIINDLAMRNIFPNFSKFLQENYSNYKAYEYKTNRNFRYKYNSEKEIYPVEVYKLKVSDF